MIRCLANDIYLLRVVTLHRTLYHDQRKLKITQKPNFSIKSSGMHKKIAVILCDALPNFMYVTVCQYLNIRVFS